MVGSTIVAGSGARTMTRYKELRRMERALQTLDYEELRWAMEWAQWRLRHATRKDHIKTWKKRLEAVRNALSDATPPFLSSDGTLRGRNNS